MARAAVRWSFSWASSWDEIRSEAYQQKWLAMFAGPSALGPRAPFFHPAVAGAWLSAPGQTENGHPLFLSAHSPDGHEVLLPLVCQNVGGHTGVRKLTPLGGRHFDYHDPLASGPSGLDLQASGYWRALRSVVPVAAGGWLCQFGQVRVRASQAAEGAGWRQGDVSPYLDLQAYSDFTAYFRSRKKGLRDDVKRQINRLKALGDLQFHVCGPQEAQSAVWASRLCEARAQRYPGGNQPADYFRALCARAAQGPVHFSVLSLNGQDISWHIGFVTDGVFFYYVPSFDPAFDAYSPGKVHLYYLLQDAYAKGLQGFDFLRGNESYKFAWADGALIGNRRFKTWRLRGLP